MGVSVALTIAGSDPSGGAGLQGDLKTFHAHGVYGQAVVTLLTVQNTLGVVRSEPVAPSLIEAQLAALWPDMPPQAAKTGALPSAASLEVIAKAFRAQPCPLVVDPVLGASAGRALSAEDLTRAFVDTLIPVATLVTPNALEAERLTGVAVRDAEGAERAGRVLLGMGASAALVKGGHMPGQPVDVLVTRDGARLHLPAPRVETPHTHGTGCTYAAAITAWLARGCDVPTSVQRAKVWLVRVLAQPLELGRGHGPLNHFVQVGEEP